MKAKLLTRDFTNPSAIQRQFEECTTKQVLNLPHYTVTFTASALTQKVDCGRYCDRFIIVDINAAVHVYRTESDNRYLYLTAGGACIVTVIPYKEGE